MVQKYLLKRYKPYYRARGSLLQELINYIERCHLEDGGYFFARIPPSSGTDTYFAVKSLALMGVKPSNPEAVIDFFLRQIKACTLSGIVGIFSAVEVISELGQVTDSLRIYAENQISKWQNKAGGFGALENIYVEVSSELEETYRAVRTLKVIDSIPDEQVIVGFVSSLLNQDGGYGRNGHSTLASTFYATEIYKLLGVGAQKPDSTRSYLKMREKGRQIQFIEDLYWLVGSLANLGEKPCSTGRITNFILACQRPNGGFARAAIMGIPTLEYTFYALSILIAIGALRNVPDFQEEAK